MTYSILTPFTLIIVTLIIAFVFIDAFVIWMFTGKTRVSFWRSFWGAFLANLITAVMGVFVGFNDNNKENLIWFAIIAGITVVAHWLFYIPFFRKKEVYAFKLFVISLFSNIIVFSVLAFLLFYQTGVLTQYFDLSFIEDLKISL